MLKQILASALIITPLLLAGGFATAQDRDPATADGAAQTSPGSGAASGVACNASGIGIVESSAMKMESGAMKTSAMSEIKMAKDMMAKKDNKGCMMHLDKANEMIRKP